MSLGDDQSRTSKSYLSIYAGKIVREWKEKPKEEWVPLGKTVLERVNKNDKEVWYVEWDFIDGLIEKVTLDTEGDFGDRVLIDLSSDGESYTLTFPAGSQYANKFYCKMDSLDLTKPVKFKPYSFTTEDDKKRTGFNLWQEGVKISDIYTKDDPKGRPELEQKKVGKKTVWDGVDRLNFYYEKLEEFIKKVSLISKEKEEKQKENTVPVEADGLPF